jgi:Protein of unknown function (DUF3455)
VLLYRKARARGKDGGARIGDGYEGDTVADSAIPEKLRLPDGQVELLKVHARGYQVYVSQRDDHGKLAWLLKGPLAELFDSQGDVVGAHYAGPTWKLNDGSEVKGKLLEKADAPESGAIPWLLIEIANNAGVGVLKAANYIHRVATKGGLPSNDPGAEKSESKSEYSADYYFYGAK